MRDERRQAERDAFSLLLFSATLRPALFAPTTGAPSLLRAVSLSKSLEPVYDLATRVAKDADHLHGVRLDTSLFRAALTGTWDEEFASFVRRALDWHARADAKRNLFSRADKVWRDLLAPGGRLAELVGLLSEPDHEARSHVEAIRKQISEQKAFNDLVRRTDRRSRKGNPIQGRALKQIWNDVQPAIELSREWLSMMDIRPHASGFVAQRIVALRNDIRRLGATAGTAIEHATVSGPSAAALDATLKVATSAVNDLLQVFDPPAAIAESSLGANVIRSRDLLYVTDVDIDTSFNPVSTDQTRLFDRLLDTAAHADTMRGASTPGSNEVTSSARVSLSISSRPKKMTMWMSASCPLPAASTTVGGPYVPTCGVRRSTSSAPSAAVSFRPTIATKCRRHSLHCDKWPSLRP